MLRKSLGFAFITSIKNTSSSLELRTCQLSQEILPTIIPNDPFTPYSPFTFICLTANSTAASYPYTPIPQITATALSLR